MRAKIIMATVFSLIGLGLVVGGIALVTQDEVSCEIGGSTLQPGESCANALPRGRGVVVNDYEEQRAGNQKAGYVGIAFGALFLVIGVSAVLPSKAKEAAPPAST